MIALLQRVLQAGVTIDDNKKCHIQKGLLVFLGISRKDTFQDIDCLASKIINLRIFQDEENKMNLSVQDVDGDILVVSQFTLHASIKKGNRPSFAEAANPTQAVPLYEHFIAEVSKKFNKKIKTGKFGADMKIDFINDGPVTIIIDTEKR